MELTLNQHGFLAKFYRSFYNTPDLPNNLCNYFWKLIFAFICIPIVYPILIINRIWYPIYKNGNYYEFNFYSRIGTPFGGVLNLIILLLGLLSTSMFYGDDLTLYMSVWKIYINGLLGVGLFTGLLSLIVFSIYKFSQFFTKEKKYLTQEEYILKFEKEAEKLRRKREKREKSFWFLMFKYLKALKEKNCPLIKWK